MEDTFFILQIKPLALFVLQVLVLAFGLYWVMRFLKGTLVVAYLMIGIIGLLLVNWLLIETEMQELTWLMDKIFTALPIAIIILFRDEIRHVISQTVEKITPEWVPWRSRPKLNEIIVECMCEVLPKFSASRTGALLAIEQRRSLEDYCKRGKRIRAELISGNGLLETIFYSGTELHDGGVILRAGYIEAASCVFPVTDNASIRSLFGMRHQAAVGLSEKTDAVVLVVSEENGNIHLVHDGKMMLMHSPSELREILEKYLSRSEDKETPLDSQVKGFWNKIRAIGKWLWRNKSASVRGKE